MLVSARLHKIDGEIGEDEDWLQRYIANHPEILPLRDQEGIDTNLQLIARELLDIDLLFADNRGLLTLVETKLYKNPEAKRQVIAQVLDYASRIRDLSVTELCKLVASSNKSHVVTAIEGLDEFVTVMNKHILDEGSENSESIGKAILAHYVVQRKVSASPNLSVHEKLFLKRLDLMLKEESFRLVIVMNKAPMDFYDILNYTASTTRRGTQLVAVELSIEMLGNEKFFVPHLIGTLNRLSAEYYREEKTADRVIQDWDAEKYLARLPQGWRGEVSRIISQVQDQNGILTWEFGKGRTGALLLGARIERLGRRNNLLEIRADGLTKIYGSLASSGLSEAQKEALVTEIARRPFLRQVARAIAEGMKTKKYGAEPEVNLETFGKGEALVENVVNLLRDYHRIANN